MKFILSLVLLFSTQVYGADFTISISGGGASKQIYGDDVALGPVQDIGMYSYVNLNGVNWLINSSPAAMVANGYGDYLPQVGGCFYESNNCSGDCLVPSTANQLFLLDKAGAVFGQARDKVIIMSDETVESDGSLAFSSCWDSYGSSCNTSATPNCSGSYLFMSGNLAKNGTVFKKGTMYPRSSFPNRPAHGFYFKKVIIK
jgi:hypothetical protein